MPITADGVKATYPQFAVYSDPEIWNAIQEAELQCRGEVWNYTNKDQATLLYTAHVLELQWQQSIQTSGASTAIAQGEAGNFMLPAGDMLDRTIYGQRFKVIADSLPITGFSL